MRFSDSRKRSRNRSPVGSDGVDRSGDRREGRRQVVLLCDAPDHVAHLPDGAGYYEPDTAGPQLGVRGHEHPWALTSTNGVVSASITARTPGLVRLHSDPNVAHWSGQWTHDEARAWAEDMAARWRTDRVGKWIAHRRTDGLLIGRGGLSRRLVDGALRHELGWAIRDAQRGCGYATEIGAAGLAYAFETLACDEVVAYTEVHNTASRAVMQRLDMQFVKVIFERGVIEGHDGIHDRAPFALYRRTAARTGRSRPETGAVAPMSLGVPAGHGTKRHAAR